MYFLKILLFIFRERGREGEREGEIHQYVVAPCWRSGLQPWQVPQMEIELRPFGLQASTQSAEPHQPGPYVFLYVLITKHTKRKLKQNAKYLLRLLHLF